MTITLQLAAALLLLWGFFKWFEWKNLYHPVRAISWTPADQGLQYEEIQLVTEDDHQLTAWWIPAENAAGTLLLCHGNGGNMGHRVELLGDLKRMGVNVLIFDYRGYGKSPGLPTEKGLYGDARAAFEWIRAAQYQHAERPPVVAYGRSLGGAVAIQLALDKPLAGLILENTFTSVRAMGEKLYPMPGFGRLVTQRYDSLSKIGKVQIPLLVAASPYDAMVPFSMGCELFEQAHEPKEFVELGGGHHASGWHTTPAYWDRFKTFLETVFAANNACPPPHNAHT